MATQHTINGASVKSRHPLAPLALGIVTLGLYYLYWYWKINKELEDVTGQGNAIVSLLALIPGSILIVPPLVSWFNTAGRITAAQDRAGVSSPISAVLALVLLFIPIANFFAAAYLQSGLNRVWDKMAAPVPAPAPAAPAGNQAAPAVPPIAGAGA